MDAADGMNTTVISMAINRKLPFQCYITPYHFVAPIIYSVQHQLDTDFDDDFWKITMTMIYPI